MSATLDALKAKLKTLNTQKSNIDAEVKGFNNRISDLEKAVDAINKASNKNYDDVNDYIKKIKNTAGDALKGGPYAGRVIGSVNRAVESEVVFDGNLGNAIAALNNEKSKIKKKLDSKVDELTKVQTQIDSVNRLIQEEKSRARSEFFGNLFV